MFDEGINDPGPQSISNTDPPFGDRRSRFAILIAARLERPTWPPLTFGTADGGSGGSFRDAPCATCEFRSHSHGVLEIWASHKESSPHIARSGTRL
jgi:hypothetical protein